MTEQTPMTAYAIAQHVPSGEYYAIRYEHRSGVITGIAGPLTDDERNAPDLDPDYDDQPEDISWANQLGDSPWRFVRDL